MAILLVATLWQQKALTENLGKSDDDTQLQQTLAGLQQTNEQIADLSRALSGPSREREALVNSSEAAVLLSTLSDPEIRRNATRILERLSDERADARLVELAKNDADTDVRALALQALRRKNSPLVGDVVIEMLTGGRAAERRVAASVLREMPDRRYTKTVVEELGKTAMADANGRAVATDLVLFLKQTADASAADTLFALLAQEPETKRAHMLAEALIACTDRRHLPLLVKALQSRRGKPASIAPHDPIVPLLDALAEHNDRRATKAVLPYLLSDNSYIQRAAVTAAVQLRDPVAAEALVDAYGKLGSYNKLRIQRAFVKGYPGVVFDKEKEEAKLVPEDDLQQLIEERNAALKKHAALVGADD